MDYNLNGIVTLRIEKGALPEFEKQFSYWKLEESLDKVDLAISRGKTRASNIVKASNEYAFFDGGILRMERESRMEFSPGRLVLEGPIDERHIGCFLTYGINQLLLRKRWSLAHASAVVYNGKAMILPAMGGTGKTMVMLELLSRGAGFMGDDRVLFGSGGEMALYPRWIHILEHNLGFFPELFERAYSEKDERNKQRSRLRKYRKGLKMAGNNPLTRYLKGHYTSYYYYDAMIHPQRLFPDSMMVRSSKVDCAFFLKKTESTPCIIDSSPESLARLTVNSSDMEGGWAFRTLCRLANIDYLDYPLQIETMRKGFEQAKCFEVHVREFHKRSEVASLVDEILHVIE